MICEICKKNKATVHVTKIVNNNKQEFNICEECAREMDGLNFNDSLNFGTPFSFQNILSGIMDYVSQPAQSIKSSDLVCENCKTSYREFKEQGLLGCSECYRYFNSTIMPVVKRVQGNVEHTGKIPNKSGKDIIERKKLIKLKEDLQKAIALEEYEKAAEIRDMIRQVQKPKESK